MLTMHLVGLGLMASPALVSATPPAEGTVATAPAAPASTTPASEEPSPPSATAAAATAENTPAPEVPTPDALTATATAPDAAGAHGAAAPIPGQRDPLEGFNRFNYRITQPIDRYIMRPVAMAYVHVAPRPLRDGIHNGLSNLFEPVNFVNDILQLRPKRAVRVFARFLLNTTLGIGGLFDVAKRKPFYLHDRNNGFGDTLAYYGVKPGPYLFLPLMGPSTLRDSFGAIGDYFAQPILLGNLAHPDADKSFFHNSLKMGTTGKIIVGLAGLDERARNDGALQALKASSVDPYASMRAAFLQNREAEIAEIKAKDGAPASVPAFDDPLADPAAAPASAPAQTPAPAPKPAPTPAPATTPQP